MTGYLAALAAKANGTASPVRPHAEPFYGTMRATGEPARVPEFQQPANPGEETSDGALASGATIELHEPESNDARPAASASRATIDSPTPNAGGPASPLAQQIGALERYPDIDASRVQPQVRAQADVGRWPEKTLLAGAERENAVDDGSELRAGGSPERQRIALPVSDRGQRLDVQTIDARQPTHAARRAAPPTREQGADGDVSTQPHDRTERAHDASTPAGRPLRAVPEVETRTVILADNRSPPADAAKSPAVEGALGPVLPASRSPSDHEPQTASLATTVTSVEARATITSRSPAGPSRLDQAWRQATEPSVRSTPADSGLDRDVPRPSANPAIVPARGSTAPAGLRGSDRSMRTATVTSSADARPAVQVTIGRIEIREQRAAAPAPVRRPISPRMKLGDYLHRRLRGARDE